jgi:UDP-N-acetylmuramate dehydrogenase
MKIEQNYSLQQYNTFQLQVKSRWFMEYNSEEELLKILQDEYFQESRSLSVGTGSNLLFIDHFDGVILHSAIKGISIQNETDDSVLLRIGAAELWDDVVAYAVDQGWGGIENLSLIPGQTGAAAVQNIGAYGVEIKDVIESVEAYNQLTFEKKVFSNAECEYSYRDSVFKKEHNDPFIITYVNIRLSKHPAYILTYGNLKEYLNTDAGLTLTNVRNAVIAMRKSKLPDPAELGNAGSFFMNPIVSYAQFDALKNKFREIPHYVVSDTAIKIPAGWLIEQCGLKGKSHGAVGVYDKQALIIVNLGGATGYEIALFAESIRNIVNDKFGILLTPEVKYIG